MRKRFTSTALFCLSFIYKITSITADQPFVRFNTGCKLLLNKTRIYCYSGGYAKNVGLEITALADHYYLDVRNDFDIATGINSWMRVPDPTNFVPEATFGYDSVQISDTSVLINDGTGINDGKTFMKNRTVIYHADKNEWESVPNTNTYNQSYYSSGALAGKDTVVFWGGAAIVGDPIPTFGGTSKLSLSTKKWSLQANSLAPGNPRYGHSTTVDPTGKLIYYFGGRDMILESSTGKYSRPFSTFTNILIYHTDTSVWESKIASSTVTPSDRLSHTASWIPGTDGILIYGGSTLDSIGTRITVQDYIYIYNTTTNVFQNVTIATTPGANGPGPRFGHSAIIRDKALFILFGIDNSKYAQSDFHVLDLDTFAWQTKYIANKAFTPGNTNTPNGQDANGNNKDGSKSTTSDGGSSISSGAIAGIVVAIIAVVAIILVIIFMRRRSRKKKERANDEYTPYWDVTSLNKKDADGEHDYPLTSTGPVDITKLPGYTTCRTGQPANIINDNDVNPPSSNPQILLSQDANNHNLQLSPQNTESSHTFTNNVSEPEKIWPPDVAKTSIVTPSAPIEYTKPDIGKH